MEVKAVSEYKEPEYLQGKKDRRTILKESFRNTGKISMVVMLAIQMIKSKVFANEYSSQTFLGAMPLSPIEVIIKPNLFKVGIVTLIFMLLTVISTTFYKFMINRQEKNDETNKKIKLKNRVAVGIEIIGVVGSLIFFSVGTDIFYNEFAILGGIPLIVFTYFLIASSVLFLKNNRNSTEKTSSRNILLIVHVVCTLISLVVYCFFCFAMNSFYQQAMWDY